MTSATPPDASGVRVRPMRVADLDAVMPFEQQMFGPEAWSRQGYLDELADTELRYYIVAEAADHHLLGTAGLLTIGETAQILTIGVLPAARRNGVGRLLLRALIAEARRRRATEVLLEVREDNHAAQRLYAAEGFTVLGKRRGYYEQGRVDAITMRHPIQRHPIQGQQPQRQQPQRQQPQRQQPQRQQPQGHQVQRQSQSQNQESRQP